MKNVTLAFMPYFPLSTLYLDHLLCHLIPTASPTNFASLSHQKTVLNLHYHPLGGRHRVGIGRSILSQQDKKSASGGVCGVLVELLVDPISFVGVVVDILFLVGGASG